MKNEDLIIVIYCISINCSFYINLKYILFVFSFKMSKIKIILKLKNNLYTNIF